MISFEASGKDVARKLRTLEPVANRALRSARTSVVNGGSDFMRRDVPVWPVGGGSLKSAVESEKIDIPGQAYVGNVGVNRAVAPHALDVNRGTGVDGPHGQPVTVKRGAFEPMQYTSRFGIVKTRKSKGVMRFRDRGGVIRFRKTVKATPSVFIQKDKGYVERTQQNMVDEARKQVIEIRAKLAAHFRS